MLDQTSFLTGCTHNEGRCRDKSHLGLLHKTLTGKKTRVKSENSGKHNFTTDFTIGKKKLG